MPAGEFIFAGATGDVFSHNGGIYVSSDNGSGWTDVSTGLENHNIRCFGIFGNKLFAGTYGCGMWMRNLYEMISVEFTSFTSFVDNGIVNLQWSTATESNNYGFEIERKSDGDFINVGFVKGAGTTTEARSYAFADSKLPGGKYYYRLKQIDFDGTSSYSKEIEVITVNEFALELNYPNPFNPSTAIKFVLPEFVILRIYDITGNEVSELINGVVEAGVHTVNFDASNYASSIYIYKLTAGGKTFVRKMTLLK